MKNNSITFILFCNFIYVQNSFCQSKSESILTGKWQMETMFKTEGYPYTKKGIIVSDSSGKYFITINNDGTYFYGQEDEFHMTYYYRIDENLKIMFWSPEKTAEKNKCYLFKIINNNLVLFMLDQKPYDEYYYFQIYLLTRIKN